MSSLRSEAERDVASLTVREAIFCQLQKIVMMILIKLVAAAVIGFAVLHPTSTPKAENCECKAKAN